MSSAVGLRDQRLSIYGRRNDGNDGFARPVFSLLYTRWGRLDDSAAAVSQAQAKLQLKVDAICDFADETVVPPNGVLKGTDGLMWWVRGIYSVRQLRRVIVGLDRVTEEQVATFQVYEGDSTLDGVHLVEPAT